MNRALLMGAALIAAPALAQEQASPPPPPPLAIPADDLIAPPEITAEEEAVSRVDPSRRHRTPAEIAASRKSIETVVATARTEGAAPAHEARAVAVAKTAPAVPRHSRAWAANADHLSFLSDRHKALVGQLAYAGAAANLCNGVRLAPDQVSAGFAELQSGASGDGTLHERRLLVAYGVAVGLMMADHEANIPAFCDEAAASASGGVQVYLTAVQR